MLARLPRVWLAVALLHAQALPLALAQPALSADPAVAPAPPAAVIGSGLPVPRYVSLKSDRINLRTGPGTEYPTAWVFRRAGLPVEVIKEFEGWRQVRDAEGVTGWVLQTFVSGRRTGLILPWEIKAAAAPPATDGAGAHAPPQTAPPQTARPQAPLRVSDSDRARTLAMVEAGVIANVSSCDGRWCLVTIEELRGYIEQGKLWGIYPNEIIR